MCAAAVANPACEFPNIYTLGGGKRLEKSGDLADAAFGVIICAMPDMQSFVKRFAALLPLPEFAEFRARFAELAKAAGETSDARRLGNMVELIDELLAARKSELSPAVVDALYELYNDLWDEEIRQDVLSGALDPLIEEARAEEKRRKELRLVEC
jgi:hypothetical protein